MQNFPLNFEVDAVVFQGPDIFAEFRLVAVFTVTEGLFMVSKSCFELVFCHSHVCFMPVLCCYGCLIDDVFFKALVFQRAVLLLSTVAVLWFLVKIGFCF